MEFGDRLKILMKQNKVTHKKLAEDIHLGSSTVSSYVANNRQPNFEILTKIANYFDVDINFLLGFDEKVVEEKEFIVYNDVKVNDGGVMHFYNIVGKKMFPTKNIGGERVYLEIREDSIVSKGLRKKAVVEIELSSSLLENKFFAVMINDKLELVFVKKFGDVFLLENDNIQEVYNDVINVVGQITSVQHEL